jgi:hypothetical protein
MADENAFRGRHLGTPVPHKELHRRVGVNEEHVVGFDGHVIEKRKVRGATANLSLPVLEIGEHIVQRRPGPKYEDGFSVQTRQVSKVAVFILKSALNLLIGPGRVT